MRRADLPCAGTGPLPPTPRLSTLRRAVPLCAQGESTTHRPGRLAAPGSLAAARDQRVEPRPPTEGGGERRGAHRPALLLPLHSQRQLAENKTPGREFHAEGPPERGEAAAEGPRARLPVRPPALPRAVTPLLPSVPPNRAEAWGHGWCTAAAGMGAPMTPSRPHLVHPRVFLGGRKSSPSYKTYMD